MRWGLALLLTILWMALTGSVFPGNIALGAVISLLALWLLRDALGPGTIRPTWGIFPLILLFFKELAISAVTVFSTVLRPKMGLQPAIVTFPLRLTRDFEITLLANLITLTPGTMTIDVSEDRKSLLVHALDASDPEGVIRSIRDGFETRILEAFSR